MARGYHQDADASGGWRVERTWMRCGASCAVAPGIAGVGERAGIVSRRGSGGLGAGQGGLAVYRCTYGSVRWRSGVGT